MSGVRQVMRSDSPIELLLLVGTMIELTDPRGTNPLDPSERPSVVRAELVESFTETPFAETTVLLTLLEQFLPNGDAARAMIAAELPRRRHPVPLWISDLANGRVGVEAMRMTEILGDGENCVLGVRFESGAALTAIIFTDHNLGSVVKDAFFVDAPVNEVMGRIGSGEFEGPGPDRIGPWDGATARATVEAAIDLGRRTLGMPEGDHWPSARPSIEWLLARLPAGGTAEGDQEWSDQDVEDLKAEFLASPQGRGVTSSDQIFSLDMILRFGAGYNVGGPLRWSPLVVGRFLLDWMPSKVITPYADVAMLPTVLAEFVEFTHRREGVGPVLTGEVLQAVGQCVEGFCDAMAGDGPWVGDDFAELTLETLEAAVGGPAALEMLDAAPLPDELFVWDGVPEDTRERVGEYLALLDKVADAHLDVEHRTAMRRFLARVAASDPAIFRRKAAVNRGCAAIAWALCRANNTAGGYYSTDVTVKELVGWFGVTGTVSQRADPMLRAIDAPQGMYWGLLPLGTPDLLVASRRADIMAVRDQEFED